MMSKLSYLPCRAQAHRYAKNCIPSEAASISPSRAHLSGGFTLLEALVVMMIGSVLSLIAVSNLKELNNPLFNGTAQFLSFLKQARAKGMSSTYAYKVRATTTTHAIAEYATSCSSGTWTPDPSVQLTLEDGATFVDTSWAACFTSRGLAQANVTVQLHNGGGSIKRVEVMLGGGVRSYDL